MADDELFDLDFTMPGAMPPAPPPAPEPPPAAAPKLELSLVDVDAPPLAAAIAPAVPPAPPRPSFPVALTEAANLFAAGDTMGASRRLEAALKSGEKLGEHAQRTWLALCDVLQALDRRDAFEKLTLAYATRFETSPPAWREHAHASASVRGQSAGGFVLPAALDASATDALRELMKLAGATTLVDIDAGAVERVDDNGCTLLLRVFEALRKAGRNYRMTHVEHLIVQLKGMLEVGTPSHEPVWLLLVDLLQRVGPMEAFEEEAVNYAVSFEVSPPSWNPQLLVAKSDSEPKPPPAPPPSRQGLLEGEVTGLATSDIAAAITALNGSADLELDAAGLIRIDTASAQQLKQGLNEGRAGRPVHIHGLPQLPWVTLTTLELDRIATLHLRKY